MPDTDKPEPQTPDFELDGLLDEFGSGDPRRQHRAVIELLTRRLHHAAATDRRFEVGIQALYAMVATTGHPQDRLLAVATLMRLGAAVKRLRLSIEARLPALLSTTLPDPRLLDEADDRRYVADACAMAHAPWTVEYCARAGVLEETGEQARVAFVRALIGASAMLTEGLAALTGPLKAWKPTTEAPGDSSARRLRRVLASLRVVMADTSLEPGPEPGKAIADLIRAAFTGSGNPTDDKVARETADEVAAVVHELVRLRFSLATDSGTYEAMRLAQGWFPARVWESHAQRSTATALVAQDLSEAMLILARQGVTDADLSDLLGTAAGSSERARERLIELSKQPGVSDSVRSWLVSGRRVVQAQRAGLSETAQIDESIYIADLLVDSQRFRLAEASSRREILPEMAMLQPRLAQQLERLLNLSLGLCDAVEVLARKRGLRIRGAPGSLEAYSPVDHDSVDGTTGSRQVRVLRPVVEQVRESGAPFVIRKGVVESAR